MFEQMIEIAKNKLVTTNESVNSLPAPQVTVILTDRNNIYVSVNDVDGTICEELKRNNDTRVTKILTMWKNETIDLPSIKFCKAVAIIDTYNNNTDIILQGKDIYLTKKLSDLTNT